MNLSEAIAKYKLPAKDIFKKIKSGELKGISPNNKSNTTGKWSIEEQVKAQLEAKPEIPVNPVIADIKPELKDKTNPVETTVEIPQSGIIADKKEVKEVIKNDTEKRPVTVIKKRSQTRREIVRPEFQPEPHRDSSTDSAGFFWW
jgi:hypothetical protein